LTDLFCSRLFLKIRPKTDPALNQGKPLHAPQADVPATTEEKPCKVHRTQRDQADDNVR